MGGMRTLIWFHRDIRLHDHAGLSLALARKDELHATVIQPLNAGPAKLAHWQALVENFRQNLNLLHIPLTILPSESELPHLARETRSDVIFTHERMNFRDQQALNELQTKLPCSLEIHGELTLYSSAQVRNLELNALKPFTRFKKFAEAHWQVPDEIETALTDQSLGLERLKDYIWKTKAVLHYHKTRNGLMEFNDSSKLSPWLAWGVLSPRRIYFELQKFRAHTSQHEGIDALVFELIWRDYFKFLSTLQGESFFTRDGLRPTPFEYSTNDKIFEAWTKGQTGEDFVDAHMRELLKTGWMSNRGRQNVASYLAKTLKLDWLPGAEWFESQLIDEDPENNFGNWQYLAGVGTDPRDRVFNIQRQADIYDLERAYRAKWLS